jgi:hypothetical protein
VQSSVGELDTIAIGPLDLGRVAAVAAPLPDMFDDDGRPAVILGLPLLLSAAVRVDYAKGEIVLAQRADDIRTAGAIRMPVLLLDGRVIAGATVGGTDALVALDTGSNVGFHLSKAWADAHGIPGPYPTRVVDGAFGVGERSTREILVRLPLASLGPIPHDDRVALIGEGSSLDFLAGEVGNEVLAHCTAIVWDLEARNVWLEPPCDRAVPEPLGGWLLRREEEPKRADRPWVVQGLIDGGAAASAGVRVGDRLLEEDGKPATRARAIKESVRRPAGTRVPVVLERDGKTRRVVLKLVRAP